jgi:hypothetical protein
MSLLVRYCRTQPGSLRGWDPRSRPHCTKLLVTNVSPPTEESVKPPKGASLTVFLVMMFPPQALGVTSERRLLGMGR